MALLNFLLNVSTRQCGLADLTYNTCDCVSNVNGHLSTVLARRRHATWWVNLSYKLRLYCCRRWPPPTRPMNFLWHYCPVFTQNNLSAEFSSRVLFYSQTGKFAYTFPLKQCCHFYSWLQWVLTGKWNSKSFNATNFTSWVNISRTLQSTWPIKLGKRKKRKNKLKLKQLNNCHLRHIRHWK